MIANGWLSASDYYRALAETRGVPFRGEIGPDEVTAPASLRGPRECLARGLVKERGRGGAYVFAPKLRPSAVGVVLARLAPHRLSLASPDTLRQVICGHFRKPSVDGLHARFPDRSAKARLSLWQRLLFLWPPRLRGCARPPRTARLARAFACARFHLPAGDRASRLRGLRSLAPGAFEACPATHSRCRASGLHHPHATLPRGQYARLAHLSARAPRLSGSEARHQIGPGGGRRRDDRGSAEAPSSGQCRDRGGAGPSPAHQAEGAQLCVAVRPRRISRHL